MSNWTCLAWVGQGGHFDRCGQPTVVVDPVFGGPLCQDHRRTTVVPIMTCCKCGQKIRPGEYFEYYEGIRRERKDGTDPVICRPCLLTLIGALVDTLKRVPAGLWEEDDE